MKHRTYDNPWTAWPAIAAAALVAAVVLVVTGDLLLATACWTVGLVATTMHVVHLVKLRARR